jgi:hypothetical protein
VEEDVVVAARAGLEEGLQPGEGVTQGDVVKLWFLGDTMLWEPRLLIRRLIWRIRLLARVK